MMRALFTAASGMIAQQYNIDTISNNLANVNTTGFRRNQARFQDLVYQTLRAPGAPVGASELYLNEDIFVRYFASDLPRGEAERLWASQRGASTAAFSTPSKHAAWKTIPSWYFISSNDQIITAASELAMAYRAHSQITIFHGGSHLTLISHPNAVTAVIASAVCSLR